MTVRVKLFAVARQLAGDPELALAVPEAATIADVRRAMLLAAPKLQEILRHARWAVDTQFANDATRVTQYSEIALIPPVSGG